VIKVSGLGTLEVFSMIIIECKCKSSCNQEFKLINIVHDNNQDQASEERQQPQNQRKSSTSNLMGAMRRCWAIQTKAIGARKGEGIDGGFADKSEKCGSSMTRTKEAVVMNDLAYHHLIMPCMDKAFFYIQVTQDLEEHGDMRKAWKELCCRYKDVLENDLIGSSHDQIQCMQDEDHQ